MQVKPELLSRLSDLDLNSASQFLYSYYRIAEEIDTLELSVSEIARIMSHIRKEIGKINQFTKLENKSITTILVFMREFLYDDIETLKAIIEV
jgi:hypothetical protein